MGALNQGLTERFNRGEVNYGGGAPNPTGVTGTPTLSGTPTRKELPFDTGFNSEYGGITPWTAPQKSTSQGSPLTSNLAAIAQRLMGEGNKQQAPTGQVPSSQILMGEGNRYNEPGPVSSAPQGNVYRPYSMTQTMPAQLPDGLSAPNLAPPAQLGGQGQLNIAPAPAAEPQVQQPAAPIDYDGLGLDSYRAHNGGNLVAPVDPGDPVLQSGVQASLDSSRNDLQSVSQQLLADKLAQEGRLELDAGIAQNRLGDSRNNALTSLKQGLANSGMLRSGANATEQGRIGTAYAQSSDDIANQALRSGNQINSDFTRNMSGINQSLSDLSKEEAGLLSETGLANDETFANQQANYNQNLQDVNNFQGTPLEQAIGGATTLEGLQYLLSTIFSDNGVNIGTGQETEQARIQRIANEVLGGRSLDNVRGSVEGIARREGGN